VSTQDRTISPDLERFMAKRMGATTIEVNASHLSLISHPAEIANLIMLAAAQAEGVRNQQGEPSADLTASSRFVDSAPDQPLV